MASFPAAAASGRPNTGEGTKWLPRAACRSASERASATLIVLIEICTPPSPKVSRKPSLPATTDSSAASLATIVITNPPCSTAAAGVAARLAPRATKRSAGPGLRL